MIGLRKLLMLLPALLAGGCSGTDALNAVAPRAGIETVRDVAYGEGPRRRLDIYRPAGASGAPVIVFFYGGGWESGARADYRFVASALAARGFVTVVPDYRLYPEVRFPAFLQDGAAAVGWVRRHIAGQGGDPGHIVLVGHSAGAYIAAMLALDGQWLRAAGLDAHRDIAGMAGLAGPYDFLPLREANLKAIFGPEATLARTQPITFANGRAAPLLLAAGTADSRVDPGNSRRLAAKVCAAGGQAKLVLYPGIDHALIVGAIGRPLTFLAPVLDDLDRFARAPDAARCGPPG